MTRILLALLLGVTLFCGYALYESVVIAHANPYVQWPSEKPTFILIFACDNTYCPCNQQYCEGADPTGNHQDWMRFDSEESALNYINSRDLDKFWPMTLAKETPRFQFWFKNDGSPQQMLWSDPCPTRDCFWR